jgi:hypothetical protein
MEPKYIIGIIIFVLLILILFKNNEGFLTGNESVANITKVYADASGTATFNNINSNKITTNKITTAEINITGTGNTIFPITGNLDVSGNTRLKQNLTVAGNLDLSGNLQVTGSNVNRIVNGALVVDKICFTDGTCMTSGGGKIGLRLYKKDDRSRYRGFEFGTNAIGNSLGFQILGSGDHHWQGYASPWNENDTLYLSSTPYA